eukprot:TRINITY_DN11382_c0_g2_i1.p1 TRINITY_DN11382_c0_g2~~TRINITY_DN11382_c0_g2_i1.p1  ORF type:complete len:725 (+),score=110.69 TRINITY_DN11382_c0_g2_i1:111-2285(+)
MFSKLLAAFLAANILFQAYTTYESFKSPRCPTGLSQKEKGSSCYTPMFIESKLVDVHLYLTSDAKLKWWTSEGFQELRKTPFWNATGLTYNRSAGVDAISIVPLSAPELRDVRANKSKLYVHCYLTKSGVDIDGVTASHEARHKKAPHYGVLSWDVIHTKGPLTKLLPNIQRVRRNLLSTESGVNNSSASQDQAQAVFVNLPVIDKTLAVYPRDGLKWAAAAFFASSFASPNPYLAGLRHVIAVGIVPWLVHMLQEENIRNKELKLAEEQEWILTEKAPVVPHLVPKVQISMSLDFEEYDSQYPPPLLYKEFVFGEGPHPTMPLERDVRYPVFETSNGERSYAPEINLGTWGIERRLWRPLNSSAESEDPEVIVELSVDGMIQHSVVESFKQYLKIYMQMGFTEDDFDDIRQFLFRYPLHIMAIMQLIGFMQMTLTTLAFKNDITFFKGRSDFTGLSSRSLMTDTVQELIIFEYLRDYESISRIVLFQVGMQTLISAWKFVRVARLRIKFQYLLPWITYNRGSQAQWENNTEEIDAKGMRYLKMVLYPLSVGWGVWNLAHYSYKSWWSWLISSLADFAYTFGFINMMPQIFINYKLKSVAHMPWRVLMYKFFNTFIDDVFAFFIMSDYMTKKHRWMTLRDDIVFFIFLFQLYLYKVDPTRPDEYGNVYVESPETTEKKDVRESTDNAKLDSEARESEAKTFAVSEGEVVDEAERNTDDGGLRRR